MGIFGKWLGGGLGFAVGGPIGGLLGFLVGSMIDSTTVHTSTYTAGTGRTSQGDFGMSLLVLVAAVMKADGKVVKSELDYVKQFFVRQFGQESAKQALLMLKDILKQLVVSMIDSTTVHTTTYTAGTARTSQGDFGMSLLVLVAAVMKADGKVVKSELDYVKQFFVSQFGQESAKQALLMLKDILKQDIPVRDVCLQIKGNMDYSSRLQLLHLLFNLSLADSVIHPSEIQIIESISSYLGVNSNDFLSIRNMFIPETDSSYKILEIDPSSSNEEVKKAYRRMAMKYHPDKVSHLGDDIRKSADDKFAMVNEAYEKIKRERNIN